MTKIGLMRNVLKNPDGSKIAVVTTKLRKSGSDRDIHIINLPTIRGSEK